MQARWAPHAGCEIDLLRLHSLHAEATIHNFASSAYYPIQHGCTPSISMKTSFVCPTLTPRSTTWIFLKRQLDQWHAEGVNYQQQIIKH